MPTAPDPEEREMSPRSAKGAETTDDVEPVAKPLAEPSADEAAAETADVSGLSYEQARDELAGIVSGLESGQVPLEESMRLWRRGEALAAHCSAWLDGAQRQIAEATAPAVD